MITKTMAASTIFGANLEVLTYKEGYWDASVKTNPLLHLWSLGVEEQFYILWPFLITIILKKFQKRSFFILVGYAIFSFIFNITSAHFSSKFDFYFPFCRFWQMGIGGILAFKMYKISKSIYADVLSVVGFFTIVVGSYLLSEANLYPGWFALFPTFASAAIISTGANSLVNKYVLRNKIMVFIGKISYSLYLWHWPLLVFSRTFFPARNRHFYAEPWFVVLISVVISIFSYFAVENPIRFTKKRPVFFILLSVMFLVGIASVVIRNESGKIIRNDEFLEPSKFDLENYALDIMPTP